MIKLKEIIKEDKMEKGHIGKIFLMNRDTALEYLSLFNDIELEIGLKELKKSRQKMKGHSKALLDMDISFLEDYIKNKRN